MKWTDVNLFAYTHSGSTYLLNILLELDCCIYRGRFEDFWRAQRADAFQIARAHQIDLGVWFPRFQTHTWFTFAHPVRVRWSHQWPTEEDLGRRAILMIRDPRDALLSASKHIAQHLRLVDFLRGPVPERSLRLFSLYPAEEWALYGRLIRRLFEPACLCLVRFEDLRAQPRTEMARILDFLGVRCPPAAVEEAIAKSSFQQVRAAAERWYRQYPSLRQGTWQAMRKGQVGEWREGLDARDDVCFDGLPCRVLRDFGYAWEHSLSADPPPGADEPAVARLETWRLGWQAAERGETVVAEAAFRVAADAVAHDLSAALAVGKALACCRWAMTLYGARAWSSPAACRTLALLLEACRLMTDRPLVWVEAAKALAHAGRARTAKRLLAHARTAAQGQYGELCAIGLAHLALGDKTEARAILGEAAGIAPTEEALSRVGADLIRQGAPLLARAVLHAGHNPHWPRLVREIGRRGLASRLRSAAAYVPAPLRALAKRLLQGRRSAEP